jgi:DNA-binding PadR family transcriptional regulator
MGKSSLGEFEQIVLLIILQLGDGAFALAVLRELDRRTGRRVSRGSLYKTFDRLEQKGYLQWSVEEGPPERGGIPRRRFKVTNRGITVLRNSRNTLLGLWQGLEGVLGKWIS